MEPLSKPASGDHPELDQRLANAEAALNSLHQLYMHIDRDQADAEITKAEDTLDQLKLSLAHLENELKSPTFASNEVEQLYAAIFERSPYALTLTKMPEATLVNVNDAFLKLFGFTRQEVIGKTSTELEITYKDSKDRVAEVFKKSGAVHNFECLRRTKSGQQLTLSLNLDWISLGGEKYVLTTIRDVTSDKITQQALESTNLQAESRRKRLQAVMEALPAGVAILDAHGGNIQANSAFDRIWGGPRPEIAGIDDYDIFKAWWADTDKPVKPEEWASAQAVQKGLTVTGQVMKIQKFDGSFAYIHNNAAPIFDAQGNIDGCAVAIQEITEFKQKEEEIRQLNRTLRALSNSNQAMLHTTDEEGFLEQVCHIIIQDCGFAMVWIGYAEDDAQKTVRPVASAGFEQGYLDALNITWEDSERGKGPTGTAIRTQKPSRCNNMLTDPKFAPWREAALQRGYASSIVLPLIADGRAFGALNIYSKEPNGFSEEEENLLSELAGDLAYGITTLRLKTNQERAEQALRASEERYRSLFDNMSEGFALYEIICDKNGTPCDFRFLEINPAFERLTNLKRDEVVGNLASQVLPDLNPSWVQAFGKVALNGEPVQFDSYVEALERYFRIYAYCPSPHQFAVVLMDVTERKQAELQLQQVADKYASLFNTTSDGVYITNLDGVIQEINDAYCEMSGYSRDELTTMPVSQLEASETPEEIATHIRKVIDQKGHDRFEAKHRRKDGSLFDVDITAVHLDQDGGRIAIFARDITARKQAEERLSYLATIPDQNPGPIIEVNLNGKIIYANPAALHDFPNLIKLGSSHPYLADWEPNIQTFSQYSNRTIIRDIAVGDHYYQQSFYYLIPQQLVRIYGVDITDRKRADQVLRQSRDDLEIMVQNRTQELSIANEQLRNEVAQRLKAHQDLETSLQELQVVEEELRNNNELLVEAQKVLDTERQRYQDLFDFAPDGYLVTDCNGKIIEANQMADQLIAIPHQSLIGKPLLVFIAKQDHPIFNHLLSALRRKSDSKSHELTLQPRKGPQFTAAVRIVSATDREGKDTLRWTLRDISERKRNEELIRQNALRNEVLSEVSQSLAAAKLDESVILDIVTKTIARLVGDSCVITHVSEDGQWLEPVAWHHSKPVALELMDVLYGSSHHEAGSGPSGQALISSKPVFYPTITEEDRQALLAEDYRPYIDQVGITSLIIVPLKIGDQVVGTLGLTRDRRGKPYTAEDLSLVEILAARTAQAIQNARLYQDLQNALRNELEVREQLVQAEKFAVVGRLLASITHEINNPLQTIKNCLYLSQVDTTPGTPVYDALSMATAETNRLSNLVAQLREIYRPPAVSMHQPVDLPALLDETHTLLTGYLQEKHVTWKVLSTKPELTSNVIVEGVPDQLKQVFLNISLNAMDAMEPDGGRLTISLHGSQNDQEVGVRFQDTGPGLPQEVKEKLFEPFTTTKEKGLGLGLTICYDIIQKHEGHIEVASEPGEGATFTIWLPAKRGEA
jgi:PAS domain S-box-containing protein